MTNKLKTAHELCIDQGVDYDRLDTALKSKDNWSGMVHAYEFVTAVSAVLASWPEDDRG